MSFYKSREENRMRLHSIKAILLQELFVTYGAIEVIMDIIFFPIMSIVVFGFLSTYLSKTSGPAIGQSVLLGMLLWQVIFIIQYSVSVGSLWNIWSRNLSNLFIAPLRAREYILAQTLSGVIKALIILVLSSFISIFLFHYNLFSLGFIPLMLFIINLGLFAFSMGLIILGLIFRFGTRIQAFAWGILPMFQPLTAAFYPVRILPQPIQYVAYTLSPTYVFEAARQFLATHTLNFQLLSIAFAENLVYLVLAVWIFEYMFRKSKDTGQFARNES